MKKGLIITLAVIAVVLLLGGMYCISTYNGLIKLNEEVDAKYSDISVQLERRADLIPNLVNTVKGYAKHEKDIFENVSKARSELMNAKDINGKAAANAKLDKAVVNLLAIAENYPDLKANKNFIQLQDELAGTENRITQARKAYNDSVKDFNKNIKSFPKNLIAKSANLETREYFEVAPEKEAVPEVDFGEK